MDRFLSSAITVGKMILIAGMGVLVSGGFRHREKSLKAISFIAVKIFLPALLLTQLANDISWEMIQKYYWACILPLVPMFLGLATARLFGRFISTEFHGLLYLACSFQNVISFGVGILLNLKLPWFNKKAADEAQSYVFLYNVVHSLFLWSVGIMLIEKCAVEEEENNIALVIATTSISVVEVNASADDINEKEKGAVIKEGDVAYSPVTRLEDYKPPDLSKVPNSQRKKEEEMTWWEYIKLQLSYLVTEQLIASLIGLLIALCPPVGYLFNNPLGDIIIGSLGLLADGTLPLQLLILGVNITSDTGGTVGLPTRFLVCVITLRLLVIPLIGFGMIHILLITHLMPYQKPFVFTMLVLMCAPTAINTSIICSMYSYKVKEYTKLLFYMYVTCIFTTTIWLTIFSWYLGSD